MGYGKSMNMAPISPIKSNFTSTGGGMLPGVRMMGSPKDAGAGDMSGHGHLKKHICFAQFSLFIAKDNEGDSTTYGAVNRTEVKSGFWIGKNDKLMSSAGVVDYQTVLQDVYLAVNMEYLNINGPRPQTILTLHLGLCELSVAEMASLCKLPKETS